MKFPPLRRVLLRGFPLKPWPGPDPLDGGDKEGIRYEILPLAKNQGIGPYWSCGHWFDCIDLFPLRRRRLSWRRRLKAHLSNITGGNIKKYSRVRTSNWNSARLPERWKISNCCKTHIPMCRLHSSLAGFPMQNTRPGGWRSEPSTISHSGFFIRRISKLINSHNSKANALPLGR